MGKIIIFENINSKAIINNVNAVQKCLISLEDADKMSKMMRESSGHRMADAALCEFLSELGYEDIVEKFNAINKWYD